MRTPIVLAAALPLALAACGGGSSSARSLNAAAPSSAALTLAVDGASPTAVPVTAAVTQTSTTTLPMPPLDETCHPHLFVRTEALVDRLNRHLRKALGRIDHVLATHPISDTGGAATWEEIRDGVDAKFTVTRTGDTTYAWELDVKAQGAADFTKVFWGDIDRAGATGPHQGSGDLTLDLTALHAALPAEPAQGTITATFDLGALSRKIVLDAAGVTWDRDGDLDADLPPVAPRNAHYVWLREPGKGGSLVAADEMVFGCPANPQLAAASVELVSRWYVAGDGTVHGRSDARMAGGQLGATQQVLGVTCHARPPSTEDAAEGFWMMKLEDAGAVVWARSSLTGDPAATACDPLLGAVPATDSTQGDFDFSAVDFAGKDAYPFPGML